MTEHLKWIPIGKQFKEVRPYYIIVHSVNVYLFVRFHNTRLSILDRTNQPLLNDNVII